MTVGGAIFVTIVLLVAIIARRIEPKKERKPKFVIFEARDE